MRKPLAKCHRTAPRHVGRRAVPTAHHPRRVKRLKLAIVPDPSQFGKENHDLTRYLMSNISDDTLVLSHLIGDNKFDLACERLLTLRKNTDMLAAYLSRMVRPKPGCKLP